MHNPFALVRKARKALRTASLERIPRYLPEQRKTLLEWFDSEAGPVSDPVIEFDPPFEPAEGTWEDLVRLGHLHPKTLELLKRGKTIKSERPFLHQWKAIVQAREGRTIVVSAGTGSGKTECFLVPILDSLVREALETEAPLVGLRSMLIYPLNALVIDQIGRWRSVLQHQKEVLGFDAIRIGMYNGHLRRDEELGTKLQPIIKALHLEPSDPDLRPYLPLETGEVRDRKELLTGGQSGANLMITNYSMLELALLRESDQTWLNEAKGWRHVVLDEAHSYTGGLALDLTLLLRRLRDRIKPMHPPQGYATSATFGGDGVKDLRDFARTMFGVVPEAVEVIQGTRIQLSSLNSSSGSMDEDLKKLISYVATNQDAERLRPLYFKASELLRSLIPGSDSETNKLEALLKKASEARMPDNSRALLPHRLHASLRAPMPWPSVCINPGCRGKEKFEASWSGLGWTGLDTSDDQCPHCGSPMLQPVTCDNEGCGKEGLLAHESSTADFPPKVKLTHPGSRAFGSVVLLCRPDQSEKIERNSQPIGLRADGTYSATTQDTADWLVFRLEEEQGFLCPRCEYEGHLLPTWQGLFPKGMRDLVVLDTALVDQEPAGDPMEPCRGRRVLTFSDSRQGAAKLAPRLSFTHRSLFVRRWILDAMGVVGLPTDQADQIRQKIVKLKGLEDPMFSDEIHRLESQLDESVDLDRLIRAMAKDEVRLTRWARSIEGARFEKRLQDGAKLGGLAPEGEPKETVWPGLIRSEAGRHVLTALANGAPPIGDPAFEVLYRYLETELRLAVCREFFRPPGRTPTALRLGLVEPRWHLGDAPSKLSGLGLNGDQGSDLLKALLTLLIQQGCVDPLPGVLRNDEDFGAAWLGRPITLQEGNPDERVFSLASEKPGQRVLTAYLRSAFVAANPSLDWETWLRLAGLKLWDALQEMARDKSGVLVQQPGPDGHPRLILQAIKLRFGKCVQNFRCTRCGQTTSAGALGGCLHPRFGSASPKRGIPCGGELVRCNPWAQEDERGVAYPHARRLMIDEPAPEGLTAFEHTAQRSKEGVLRDELLYRKRQANLLSSSTTLEMGVDLPDLDCVVLLGVPPAASNHTQRVGRAGRSRQRSSLALTLSGSDSFDRWAFRDLTAFLRRPGITPRVDLNRPHHLQRHFFAWRLGSLVSSGQLFSPGKDPALLQRLEQFAGLNVDQRDLIIQKWNSSERPTWTRPDATPGWGDDAHRVWLEVPEQELAQASALFDQSPATLREWLKLGAQQLADELTRIRKRDRALTADLVEAEDRLRKFLTKLQRSLRQYKTLTWLAERNVLPRYGFPISTVTLQPPKRLREEGVKEGVQRDRRQAVFEWTPGSEVVVAGRTWLPERLNADVERGERETHDRQFSFAWCHQCKGSWVFDAGQETTCPACGSGKFHMMSIARPNGFGVKTDYKVAGSADAPTQGGGARILTLGQFPDTKASLAFYPDTRVAFINPGKVGEDGIPLGFRINPEASDAVTWVHPEPRKASSSKGDPGASPTPVLLGEVLATEVLRVYLPSDASPSGYRSAGHALRLAAAFILEIDPRSLCLGDLHPATPARVDLIDLAPGGSGLLERLNDPERTASWVEKALGIASHEGVPGAGCVNACPECILTHDNRMEHLISPLDRKGAQDCLERLLASIGTS